MNNRERQSIAQIEEEMECYRKIFDSVRLLGEDRIAGLCKKTGEEKDACPCYAFWGRSTPCENCVCAKAFLSKKDALKLEFSGGGVYQVIAHYLEADGTPYVMELLRRYDTEGMIDLSGEEKLLTHINDFYEKTYTDVMTGIYNRRFYEEKLRSSVLTAGIAMIDLDDFKVYNDVYGHGAGDLVLTTFAESIKKNVRATDRLIRYGGDEFLLIMPGMRDRGFEAALHHICECIGAIVLPGYEEIRLTTSIGATLCENETVEAAVDRADRLLYRAKIRKNVVVTDRDEEGTEGRHRPKILVVDDAEINRDILSSILQNEFRVIEARDGKEAIALLERYGTGIRAVLLDILMPKADGFDVLRYMTERHLIENIPVITVTEDESGETMRKAYEMGVSDFITRPFDAKVVYRRVRNTIHLYEKQRRLLSTVSGEILEKEKNSQILVDLLSRVAELLTGREREHITNIGRITELLLTRLREKAPKYALGEKDIRLISAAAPLHDIGKLAVDRTVLAHASDLSEEEIEKLKKHTVLGAQMVAQLKEYRNEPLARYLHDICLYHHEKYDGSGFPTGRRGDDIPIAAQVVSLADAYDALTARQKGKAALGAEDAVAAILRGDAGAFNPLLTECLEEILPFLKKDENGEIR